jgi:hypothetical protein
MPPKVASVRKPRRHRCEGGNCRRLIEARYRLCPECCRRWLQTFGVPWPLIELADLDAYQTDPARIGKETIESIIEDLTTQRT